MLIRDMLELARKHNLKVPAKARKRKANLEAFLLESGLLQTTGQDSNPRILQRTWNFTKWLANETSSHLSNLWNSAANFWQGR